MLDREDYLLFRAILNELRIQNDLKVLEMKLTSGELKATSNIRKRLKEIEDKRDDSIK